MARMNIGKGLLSVCAFLCISAPELWASADAPLPAATSFAYSASHPVMPLPAVGDRAHRSTPTAAIPMTPTPSTRRTSTRVDVRDRPAARIVAQPACATPSSSVARANDLPIPFFANLIWQESNFDVKSISRAGALGVAQYMPQTANDQGLINPFEPIHALHVAGKLPAPAAGAVRQSRPGGGGL